MSQNLFTTLRGAFAPHLERPFVRTLDGAVLRYADMVEITGRIANFLVEQGLRPGDRLVAKVEKSVESLLVYLATVRAGGVYVPLNPAYTPVETAYFLNDAAPTIFVRSPQEHAGQDPGATSFTLGTKREGTLWDACMAHPSDFTDVDRDADHLAAILYTSGTTGRSKGAMLSHGNLASNCLVLRDAWRFTAEDRLLHALPIFHTHGLFVATNVTLASGASLHFHPGFDIRAIVDGLPEATVLMGVPTFYSRLLAEEDFGREQSAGIRLFVSGSAPLSVEVAREFEARTGHTILERYGMTETNMITSNPYEGDRLPGSVGPPLPGVSVRVAAEDGSEDADIGVLKVRGPNVFKGYWNMPEKTASEFDADGYFITGDLGRIDERGYVWLLGRSKDLIISGGFNVYPAEVEQALEAVAGVAESAVVGVPHADMGEAVIAFVVPEAGAACDAEDIGGALARSLARYKQPRRILVVDTLPRNAMGKIQKNKLREAQSDLFAVAR